MGRELDGPGSLKKAFLRGEAASRALRIEGTGDPAALVKSFSLSVTSQRSGTPSFFADDDDTCNSGISRGTSARQTTETDLDLIVDDILCDRVLVDDGFVGRAGRDRRFGRVARPLVGRTGLVGDL